LPTAGDEQLNQDPTLGGGSASRPGGQRAQGSDDFARGQIEFECVDFCPICRTADVLRATMPAEFQEHWRSWQRELLLAARSLLDHYIEHVETERRRATPVEDIPIE
jgi:hypothetical protein